MLNSKLSGLIACLLLTGGAGAGWAATLPTSHQCRAAAAGVECTARRGSHWPLLMALGLGQLAAGAFLLLQRDDDDNPTDGDRSPSLTPSPADGGAGASLGGGEYDWVQSLIKFPAVQITGAMGSGKSTFARWLIEQRRALGYEILVLDPHRKKGDWTGLDVVGGGQDYQAVEDTLTRILADIKTRYQRLEVEDDPKFAPVCVVCEEMLQWSAQIDPEVLAGFDSAAAADIRKVSYKLIKISQHNTLSSLGGKAGLKGVQSHYCQLELLTVPNPQVDDGVSPAFKGVLTLPKSQPVEVKINPAWRPSSLGSSSDGERSLNPAAEPLNPSQSIDLGNLAPYQVQALNLNKTLSVNGEGTEERITRLASEGLTQDQIIEAIWGVKKGGSEKYKTAREIVQKYLKGA